MWCSRIGIGGVREGTRWSFLGFRRRQSVSVLGGFRHLLGPGLVVVVEVLVRTLLMTVMEESVVEEGKVLSVVKGIVSGL